jgi:hypothetical protein
MVRLRGPKTTLELKFRDPDMQLRVRRFKGYNSTSLRTCDALYSFEFEIEGVDGSNKYDSST